MAEFQASEEGDGRIFLSRTLNPVPAVYVWGVGNEVVYVGSCERLFNRHRIGRRGVELPGKPQYCVAQLREALAHSEQVKVKLYAYTPEPVDWNGMHITLRLDIEHRLIHEIQPLWNVAGTPRTLKVYRKAAKKAHRGMKKRQQAKLAMAAGDTPPFRSRKTRWNCNECGADQPSGGQLNGRVPNSGMRSPATGSPAGRRRR